MLITKQLLVVIDFHSAEKNKYTMEVNGYQQFWLPTFFKIYIFVFNRRKKIVQFWNYLRVIKWWQFSFLGELSL